MSCPRNLSDIDPIDVVIGLISDAGFADASEQLQTGIDAGRDPSEAILEILTQIDAVLYAHPMTGALELRVLGDSYDHSRLN